MADERGPPHLRVQPSTEWTARVFPMKQTVPLPLATIAVERKGDRLLTTIVIVLVVLWLLGLATAYTAGGLIHILLVLAIISVLVRVIQGRNPLRG